MPETVKYISLFSGIAGFEKGIERAFEKYYNQNFTTSKRQQQRILQGNGNDAHSEQIIVGTQQSDSCGSGKRNQNKNGRECLERAVGNSLQPSRDCTDSTFQREGQYGRKRANCIGYSEIDQRAIEIYRYHYPEHKNYGSATDIICDELPDFDLLVGGFPCQTFSIAGKRQGFEDTRGTLFFEIARILEAKKPRNFLLENVGGLFSHDNGRTFDTIRRTLTNLGYFLEWDYLNSKNYGVAQNRERVFLVGYFGRVPKREIFPLGESNGETFPAESERNISGTISTKNQSGQCQFDGSTTLVISDSGIGRSHQIRENCPPLRSSTGGGNTPMIIDKQGKPKNKTIASALQAGGNGAGNHGDMDLIQINSSEKSKWTGRDKILDRNTSEVVGALDAHYYKGHDGKRTLIKETQKEIQVGTLRTHNDGKGFRQMKDGNCRTIPARAREDGSGQPVIMVENPSLNEDGTVTDLDAHYYKGVGKRGNKYRVMAQTQQRIRRLTPLECERLQSFPDFWTKYGLNFKGEIIEMSDTSRYRALGNAVTVNVIEAIISKMIEAGRFE